MIDLALRCSACDRVPATLRLGEQVLCRECAHDAVDRASPPARTPRPRTEHELELAVLSAVRESDRAATLTRVCRRVGASYEKVHDAIGRLESSGEVAAVVFGNRRIGYAATERLATRAQVTEPALGEPTATALA